MILIYSRNRDQFVNDVMDWLGDSLALRITKHNHISSKFSFTSDNNSIEYSNKYITNTRSGKCVAM